jgi:IS6 family transposase
LSKLINVNVGSVAKNRRFVIKTDRLSPLNSYRESAVTESDPFKWRHYQGEIILLCVRWYLRYALSYRDLEEMIRERGLSVYHTAIYRWVQAYAPEIEKRIRPHLRLPNDSYRVDETYVKIKGKWKYLYRAVDSMGQTIDFMLSANRDARAAKRFICKILIAASHSSPRVINVDKNPAYRTPTPGSQAA